MSSPQLENEPPCPLYLKFVNLPIKRKSESFPYIEKLMKSYLH